MNRTWWIVVLGAVTVTVCLLTSGFAVAATVSSPPRAILVLAPYLTWADLSPATTPALWQMAQDGAIGGINARSRVRDYGEPPSPLEGALAISAGAWAQPDYSAASAYNGFETVEGSATAEVVYRRIFGTGMDGSHIGYLGLPAQQRANAAKSLDVTLGTLGQSIVDANGLIAAVGNSDAGAAYGAPKRMRPAAVAAMDASGLVQYGDVSSGMLREAPAAPYGVATDLTRFEAELTRVDGFARGHRGPSLIVLDPGDGYRAARFAGEVTDEVAARQHAQALKTLDSVVALARKRQGADGVVIVASQALYSETDGTPQGLGPVVVSGPGWSGYLSSASTHRKGVVTNLDVTATLLSVLGVRRPVQVLGSAMESIPGPQSVAARAAYLSRVNTAAVSVDGPKAGVLDAYIGFVVLLLAGCALVLVGSRRWRANLVRPAIVGLKAAVLLALAVPVSSWLMFVVTPLPSSLTVSVLSLVGVSLVVWGLALYAWRRWPLRVPVVALCGLTVGVLVVDQLIGARLSYTGFFGYSPLLAARFYGMGNEAASLLFGSSIVGAALAFDQWPDAVYSENARRYGLAALAVLVVGVAAAPFLGANVGVALWGLVGFALAWALMNGYRFGWKAVVATVLLVVLVIGAFSAIDLFQGSQQTHLGRALASAEQGGASQLTDIIVRKAQTNARIFTRTNWSWILAAVLAFLGFASLSPRSGFAETMRDNPRMADAILVTLVTGLVAFFSEDSGIVIPALILLYTGLALAWLLLSRSDIAEGENR